VLDFQEEIAKFKPLRTVDEVEANSKDELLDITDLMQYITQKVESVKKRSEFRP